jgi:hypothetical protein
VEVKYQEIDCLKTIQAPVFCEVPTYFDKQCTMLCCALNIVRSARSDGKSSIITPLIHKSSKLPQERIKIPSFCSVEKQNLRSIVMF